MSLFVLSCMFVSALQFLPLTLWWKAAPLYVSRPTHLTTSPAEPQEPNLLLKSPGTEMEKSWKLQFIPRYSENRSALCIIIQSPHTYTILQTVTAGKNKCKAIQKQKYFLSGYNTPIFFLISVWMLFFSIYLSRYLTLSFSIATLSSQDLFAYSLQSPSCIHSFLTPPYPPHPFHPSFSPSPPQPTSPHTTSALFTLYSLPFFCSLMQPHYSITGACQSSDRHECFIQ